MFPDGECMFPVAEHMFRIGECTFSIGEYEICQGIMISVRQGCVFFLPAGREPIGDAGPEGVSYSL